MFAPRRGAATMDCGSLLPLSDSQPAAVGNMTAQHAGFMMRPLELELANSNSLILPAQHVPAQHVAVPQQAASTKAAGACRSPRWLRYGVGNVVWKYNLLAFGAGIGLLSLT